MEKRLSVRCDDYLKDFKYNIKNFIDSSNMDISEENYHNLIQFIFDYNNIVITKADFTKRKRVKNIVPFHERCCALRATHNNVRDEKKFLKNSAEHTLKAFHTAKLQTIINLQRLLKKEKSGLKILVVLFIILIVKTMFMIITISLIIQ